MTKPRQPLATIATIAAAPILLLSGFAWAAGWIGPPRIGGGTIVGALEANAGKHEGYRRAHAKGVCFTGYFEASGKASALSRTPLLGSGHHAAIGRFSTGGGNPFATDGRNVFHAMALQLTGPGGEIWRLAMDHTPIFPVATTEAFVALQHASRPDPATGKPDPAAMKAYLAHHPETRAYQDYIAAAPLPDSFANSTYYSINAFRFIDGAGASHAVRWAFEPKAAFGALDKAKLAELPTDHLFTDLGARLAKGPLRWRMTVTVAAPGDATNDATIPWPADRQRVEAGTLTITAVQPEENGLCRDITFDPTILPDGVALSDDPLLPARSAAYSSSFQRRALEAPGPSAVGKTLAAKEAR